MSNQIYNDVTVFDIRHLRFLRNAAGEYIAVNDFNRAFEAILDMKRDIKTRNLEPSMFNNLLNESIAIGCDQSIDKKITLVKFERYLLLNHEKLLAI